MSKSGIQGAVLAAIAAMGLAASEPARASLFTIDVTEQGGNVDVVGSGSISLIGLTLVGPNNAPPEINPGDGLILFGNSTDFYTGVHGPFFFGSFGIKLPSNATGDSFGIAGGAQALFVPPSFTSGDALSGAMTFDNATIASLGLTPGVYTYTWGDFHNELIVNIEAVPEPSTWAMLALGFIGLAALGARRAAAKTAIA